MSVTSVKTGTGGLSLALNNNYMEPIATTVVGSGGVNTVIFNNIPQGYKHLQLRVLGRDNRSNYATNFYIQFNGDNSLNYADHSLYGNGATTVAAANTSQSSASLGRFTGGTTQSNTFGAAIVDILDYTNINKNKTVRSLSGYDDNGVNGGQIWLNSNLWMSTVSITSITIVPVGSLISQYSRFSLYGIKG